MSLLNILNKCRDVRSMEKMKEDIDFNDRFALQAVKNLCLYYLYEMHLTMNYNWYGDKLWSSESEVEYKQDCDLKFNGRVYPTEVKVTKHRFPERIFVRRNSITTLPDNGYLYLSEPLNFTLIKKKRVEESRQEQIPEWGNKLCYVLNKSKLKWREHLFPVYI